MKAVKQPSVRSFSTETSGTPTLPSITVRTATVDDVDVMVGLLRQLFEIESDFHFCERRQRRGLKLLLRVPSACVLVAETGGKVRGMCTVQLVVSTAEGAWSGLVEDMVVHRSWGGMGIGRRLQHAVCQWAMSQGATRVQLLADKGNTSALKFYKHMEWEGTHLVVLRKNLPPLAY